jgi:hypothetical protein
VTAEEIQENLLKVLASTVTNQATARSNATPFPDNMIAHAKAVENLSLQITAIKICCKAAGIDEDKIRDVVYLCSL